MGLYRIGNVGKFYSNAAVLADVFAQRTHTLCHTPQEKHTSRACAIERPPRT